MSENGIIAYDLEPPDKPRGVPPYTPLRHPGRISPRPRYVPPPLPEGHVRVEMDEDYYAGPGWGDWNGEDADYPARVFDIPAEQRERWRKAMDDYAAMQEEISAMMSGRRGQIPPGWTRKAPYRAQPMSERMT